MTHAELILSDLDSRLQSRVDLTLYGRAALCLGFQRPPVEYSFSMDVDGVLETGQAEEWAEKTNFWQAIEETNNALSSRGLYISHFFDETQIILTPQWKENRVVIHGPWTQLHLTRLGNGDLFLSKLMRFDPQDLSDARFIVEQAQFNTNDIHKWINRARVPEIQEIKEQFALCSKEFL
ncbi:MAG TPA: hypothetical protein DCZ95_00855 [Verrucomicrobia bacterium]|nr:MAG: hypothetical protein A2X46_16750 [Lentisphaerae bacterium GWF2_57_35]HBA82617.1 hypothetical protein [Verrucomicrobiota bacterium]